DTHYFKADVALDQAMEQARACRRRDLVPVISAYRAFLFSVMGGRLQQGDRKPYIQKAITLGNRLLSDRAVIRLPDRDREQVLFEVHNALGISYMRQGQEELQFSEQQRHAWDLAERNYAEALKLRPNATRVLQNVGTLRLTEGDQLLRSGDKEKARVQYR